MRCFAAGYEFSQGWRPFPLITSRVVRRPSGNGVRFLIPKSRSHRATFPFLEPRLGVSPARSGGVLGPSRESSLCAPYLLASSRPRTPSVRRAASPQASLARKRATLHSTKSRVPHLHADDATFGRHGATCMRPSCAASRPSASACGKLVRLRRWRRRTRTDRAAAWSAQAWFDAFALSPATNPSVPIRTSCGFTGLARFHGRRIQRRRAAGSFQRTCHRPVKATCSPKAPLLCAARAPLSHYPLSQRAHRSPRHLARNYADQWRALWWRTTVLAGFWLFSRAGCFQHSRYSFLSAVPTLPRDLGYREEFSAR